MPPEMIACPHCGTENSKKRQTCYHCQQSMAVPAPVPVARPTPVKQPSPAQANTAAAPRQSSPRLYTAFLNSVVGVSLRQRAQIFRQLYGLLHAGIPVGLALSYLEDSSPRHLRRMLHDIAHIVQGGGMISEGMARYQTIFTEWEINIIRAAEKGGNLPEVMRDLAETLEMEMELRTQLRVKMFPIYATTFVFVLVICVVGAVQAVQTGVVSDVIGALGHAFVTFCKIIAVFILLMHAWRIWARTRRGGAIAHAILSRTPLIGPILQNTMRYRFAQVLGSLWRAGVPPLDALETAARASGNGYVMHRVRDLLPELGKGATLTDVISAMRLFPQEVLYLIRSGETSGALGESLEKVCEYLRMDIEERLRTLPMKAQVFFYLLIGSGVGYFVINFWRNYFEKLFEGMPM